MTNGSDAVRQHYGMSGILDRVTAFLLERGIDPERPTYEDFLYSINSTAAVPKLRASISSALVSSRACM
jgi:hypothetical protein